MSDAEAEAAEAAAGDAAMVMRLQGETVGFRWCGNSKTLCPEINFRPRRPPEATCLVCRDWAAKRQKHRNQAHATSVATPAAKPEHQSRPGPMDEQPPPPALLHPTAEATGPPKATDLRGPGLRPGQLGSGPGSDVSSNREFVAATQSLQRGESGVDLGYWSGVKRCRVEDTTTTTTVTTASSSGVQPQVLGGSQQLVAAGSEHHLGMCNTTF